MHLPGCTVPPLVDWLSGTVALASSCYDHPEPGTGPPPWSELAINHHCPSVRSAVTMSVPLYTTCSTEPWGIQKRRKGKDLIILCTVPTLYKGQTEVSPEPLQLWCTATLGQPNLCVFWSRGKPEHLEEIQAGTGGAAQTGLLPFGLIRIVKWPFTHSRNSETICAIGILHYRISRPIFVYFMIMINVLSFVFNKNVVHFSLIQRISKQGFYSCLYLQKRSWWFRVLYNMHQR